MAQLQSLLDELLAKDHTMIRLPITHMCGIPVTVSFKHSGQYNHIRIKCGKHVEILGIKPFPSTLEGLGRAIADLDTIRFSKCLDRFYVGELPIVYEELFTGTNYTPQYIECGVCLDRTQRLTPCNHSICLECEMKLVKPSCPLCRRTIQRVYEYNE